MHSAHHILRVALILTLASVFSSSAADAQTPATYPRILRPAETSLILPPSVFFKGLSAAVQARNSSGIEWEKGRYFLVMLVDTSGYSTAVQERYQAYLLTEIPLLIDGHPLPPGAYGCGFLPGDQFLVMDIGGHDLFTANTHKEPTLKRPAPLQILPAPAQNTYRLFAGRTFVELAPQL